MKISNKLSDKDRHYINNLIVSGQGELPDENDKVSSKATHIFIVDNGFIVEARKIIRKPLDKNKKL